MARLLGALLVLPVAYLLPPGDVGPASNGILQPLVGILMVSNVRLGAHADYTHQLTDHVEVFVTLEASWSRKSHDLRGSGMTGVRVRF